MDMCGWFSTCETSVGAFKSVIFYSWLGKVFFFVFVFVCLCVFWYIKQMQAKLDNTLLMSLF